MDRLVIRGGKRIEGSVQVRGAKNAALPQIAAALLSSERLELANVPDVIDVEGTLLDDLPEGAHRRLKQAEVEGLRRGVTRP